MTWLSINPNVEPFTRKSAALALTPGVRSSANYATPTELAEAYNNVEALGLDLYSLKRKYPEPNPSEETP